MTKRQPAPAAAPPRGTLRLPLEHARRVFPFWDMRPLEAALRQEPGDKSPEREKAAGRVAHVGLDALCARRPCPAGSSTRDASCECVDVTGDWAAAPRGSPLRPFPQFGIVADVDGPLAVRLPVVSVVTPSWWALDVKRTPAITKRAARKRIKKVSVRQVKGAQARCASLGAMKWATRDAFSFGQRCAAYAGWAEEGSGQRSVTGQTWFRRAWTPSGSTRTTSGTT